MRLERNGARCVRMETHLSIFLVVVLSSFGRICLGNTNPDDVAAINSLYSSLGNPGLPNWVASGGDPCGESWQGVRCIDSDIESIILNGANLGGALGNYLEMFASIKSIDLSNNNIGGSVPSNLPTTLQTLFLSANNFTGSIPASLSSLALLTDMSLNNNHLSGVIPDAFQSLVRLINLDFSSNNLTGTLPPSLGNLSHLTTLHLQENQLSGSLDVLQNLPLRDLNIENNIFSGPIPETMLAIPNFRKDGNPFNTTFISPSISPKAPSRPHSPSPSPSPSLSPKASSASSSQKTPKKQPSGPSSSSSESHSGKGKKTLTSKKVVGIAIAGALLLIAVTLGVLLFIPSCLRKPDARKTLKQHEDGLHKGNRDSATGSGLANQITEGKPEAGDLKPRYKRSIKTGTKRGDVEDAIFMPPSPPPPPPPPPPSSPSMEVAYHPMKLVTSVRSFSIALLQQYTNSFSQENLVGSGMLGCVYRAQLPDGKFMAVKKLDKKCLRQQEEEFLELVTHIDQIRHANVVELMGYCAEYGERLLIYEYCSNGSLHETLHADVELKRKLSWGSRLQLALGAARALEYLHEVCQPPVVHRNFNSANILLDFDFAVRVSDCGLAPLISLGSVSQLSGHLQTAYAYGAPECEAGIYTPKSDVYSFGVVMLELLTGRKSFDSKQARGEQSLVSWAIVQLHDIDNLSRMVDPSLNGKYSAKSLSNFADIISKCVQNEPEFRPLMSEVVQDLMDMIWRESVRNK